MKTRILSAFLLLLAGWPMLRAADAPLIFADPLPRRYEFSARASAIDPRARPHPEIDFAFEKDGKPADVENASVDTRVAPQGKLVIWLMGYSAPLFERVNSYGLHAIRVHYANGWFNQFGKEPPPADDKFLGKIRLEAATGEDFSEVVNIPKPDGMMERASQFVKWLARENPPGRWEYFLTDDGQALRWDRVIIAGASHGSTTAARFAKHQRVDRVVMFCGPRDQYETWQALPSATPANRFFGFSHVLDTGWTGNHYCRSWELLGLQQFGLVVNVDKTAPPYGNTRRLITDADVKDDPKRAHSSVVPGNSAVKDTDGKFIHEAVWRYLFTHPVEEVGEPVPHDASCTMDLRSARNNLFAGSQAGETRDVGGMKLRWCPPGKFRMGSPPTETEHRPDEEQVEVTLTRGFWMSQYEVTQGDWKRVIGTLPGNVTVGEGDDLPVHSVNYPEAEEYCRKLTALAHAAGELPKEWEFRLPTEAQWEYACRAGTTTATAFGDTLNSKQANFAGKSYNSDEQGPSLKHAVRVGSYPPNAWGLYDMYGNAFEWCRDWYHAKLPGGNDPDLSEIKGTTNRDGTYSRVRRGGAWNDDGKYCRSAFRLRYEPERRSDHIGFRVVAVQP